MTKELLKVIKSIEERTTELETHIKGIIATQTGIIEELRQAKSLQTIAQHRQDHVTIGEIMRDFLAIFQPRLLAKLDTIAYEKPKIFIQLRDVPQVPAKPGIKTKTKRPIEAINIHKAYLRQS